MLLEPGMLVKSKAGRDKDSIYVVISVSGEYIFVADGKKKPVLQPKKKNSKHVQPILIVRSESVSSDEAIRKVIRDYEVKMHGRS